MFVVQPVGDRDVGFVPAIITSLIAADQQNCRAPGVERVECPIRSTLVLGPKFAHMAVLGVLDCAAVRKTKMRPTRFEQANRSIQRYLLFLGERVPPLLELVRVLD